MLFAASDFLPAMCGLLVLRIRIPNCSIYVIPFYLLRADWDSSHYQTCIREPKNREKKARDLFPGCPSASVSFVYLPRAVVTQKTILENTSYSLVS